MKIINETINWFFKKINAIDKFIAISRKER